MKPMKCQRPFRPAALWSVLFAFSFCPAPSRAQQASDDRPSRFGSISISQFSGRSSLRGVYLNKGFITSNFATSESQAGPTAVGSPIAMITAVLPAPSAAQTPAPILRGCGLLPMTPGTGVTPSSDENPIFNEGKQHLADPRFGRLDNPQRQKYLGEWSGLHLWQENLLNQGKEIAEDWGKVENAVNDLDAQGCRVKAEIDRLEPAIVSWKATCSGTVEQTVYDWCMDEQKRLLPLVQKRDAMFEDFKTAVEKYNNELYYPTVAKSNEWGRKVGIWEGKVQDFNQRLIEAMSNHRKADIKFIDYLVRKYKLDECQRQHLHDLITNQQYEEEEIELIAREIAMRGEYRCPPRRGGIRD